MAGRGFYWGGKNTGTDASRTMATRAHNLSGTPSTTRQAFAGKHGLINVETNFGRLAGGFRNPVTGDRLNRTTSEILAEELAKSMAAALRRSLVRPGVSTKRLERALLDPDNRVARYNMFGVGNPKFLNDKVPYWQAIEKGTSYFVGRKWYGIFGASIGEGIGGTGRYGPYPMAGPEYSGVGDAKGGRLRPLNSRYTSVWARRAIKPKAGQRVSMKMTIKTSIKAHHYMRDGWVSFDARTRGRMWARKLLAAYRAGF